MADRRLVQISKFMSLILRHEPERFGVTLDAEGFATIDELLVALRRERPEIKRSDIHAVVETVEAKKGRFAIEGNEIRAAYGHSLAGRIEHKPVVPPDLLYHGTHVRALPGIMTTGLRPMGRQYVHLTTDSETARRVGSRRGPPCLLEVAAHRAHTDGTIFYRANLTFWLVDQLDTKYLKPL